MCLIKEDRSLRARLTQTQIDYIKDLLRCKRIALEDAKDAIANIVETSITLWSNNPNAYISSKDIFIFKKQLNTHLYEGE